MRGVGVTWARVNVGIGQVALVLVFAVGLACCSSEKVGLESTFKGCWPGCSERAGGLRFGVIPSDFSMGKYLGLSISGPNDSKRSLETIKQLANGHPFYVHLYASWATGITKGLQKSISTYEKNGLYVNLALRYVPPPNENGDTSGFAKWVKQAVLELPNVQIFQVTNEANVGSSTDSDGYYKDASQALVYGVVDARKVARPGQLVGFNWAYSPDDAQTESFWSILRSKGGANFSNSVGFVGIDLYPGTYFPVATSQGVDSLEGDTSQALATLRNKLMPLAGLGSKVPIFIQETSWPDFIPPSVSGTEPPTSPQITASKLISHFLGEQIYSRTPARQAEAFRDIMAGVINSRSNIALVDWFDLVDAQMGPGDGWGLVTSSYQPKPVFWAMKVEVARYGTN